MIFIRSYFAKEGSLFSATKIKLTEKDKIIQSDYKAIEALNDFQKVLFLALIKVEIYVSLTTIFRVLLKGL